MTDANGFIYLIGRYYDPTTGQFISVDPDVASTGQPYSFAGSDPINESDPNGLFFMGDGGQTAGINSAGVPIDNSDNAAIQNAEDSRKFGTPVPAPSPFSSAPSAGVSKSFGPVPVSEGINYTIYVSSQVSSFAEYGFNDNANITAEPNGTVDVKVGVLNTTFSPNEAIAGLGADGISISGGGLSYTDQATQLIGPDRVNADITATLKPDDQLPQADIDGARVIGAGILIYWILKPACAFTGPFAGGCVIFRMNNLQFGIAQIGSKAARAIPRSMLLERNELPGDTWKMRDQRSFRIGIFGDKNEVAQRARRAGRFFAIRSFEQDVSERWLWVEVIPYTSSSDAESRVPHLRDTLIPNSLARVRVTRERDVDPLKVPDVADYPFAFEQLTHGELGPGTSRYLGGRVENVIFVIACSGSGEGWTWTEVASIASLQKIKVSTVLASG